MSGMAYDARKIARWLTVALAAAFASLVPGTALAQQVQTYSQVSNQTINGNTTCAAPVVRTINVTDQFNVANVRVGVLATHSWRGDLQITVQSPQGTRVQLTNGDTQNMNGNNFNVLMDDSFAAVVGSDSPTGNHATTAPPYQNSFRPQNPLSVLNGQAANGTWRLEVCDLFPAQDDGILRRFDLYLTQPPAQFADLSLTKSRVGAAPVSGGAVTWRLTVASASASTNTTNGVTVTDTLPPGFTFISASGFGSFNPATGVWTVGTMAPSQSRSIEITGSITASAGASVTNTAEITTSSVADSDSTVGNGAIGEDDYATNTFTVAGTRGAGTPPVLSCPAGSVLFDWDPRTWTAGSTNNSYQLTGFGTVGFALTNPGTWLNSAALGGQSPNLQTDMNGGFTGEKALIQLVDMPDRASRVTTTISFANAITGAQFKIFDVDFNANQFSDTVTVRGTYNGATVLPVLTNGVSNYVVGNNAYGDAGSATASSDGNVTATFSDPIDGIEILYGNHSTAPANPGQQAIALSDITFCNPTTTLTAAKSSTVLSDPVNLANNPKRIPGATIRYCILITNTGAAAASTIIANDAVPSDLAYVPGSITSGTTCATATTAEDDNASGGDENDPFGGSVSGTTVTGIAANLPAGQTFAFAFNATVN